LFFVDPEDIVYCESDNNYTSLFLNNKNKIFISKTIKLLEEDLKQPFFYRVHRSFIVNLNYVDSFNSYLSVIKLKDNSQIPVSDRKRKGFLEYFNNFKQ
jgi:two-component system LytT family response regulator